MDEYILPRNSVYNKFISIPRKTIMALKSAT